MDETTLLVSQRIITLFLIVFAGIYARKIQVLDWNTTKKLSAMLINIA
jgi:predicted permease